MSITLSADSSGSFGTIKINGVDQLKIYNDGSLRSPDGNIIGTSEGILGTVSQIGGIPTGAIIESDSNANGTYIKFACGNLICVWSNPTPVPVPNTAVHLFISTNVLWTFPTTFVYEPQVFGSVVLTNHPSWTANGSPSTSMVNFYVVCTATSGGGGYLRTLAIGRWF